MYICALPGKAVPEMTYTLSGGTLNPILTHSLICLPTWYQIAGVSKRVRSTSLYHSRQCSVARTWSTLGSHRLHRRLLYDARLQQKVVKTVPARAVCGLMKLWFSRLVLLRWNDEVYQSEHVFITAARSLKHVQLTVQDQIQYSGAMCTVRSFCL